MCGWGERGRVEEGYVVFLGFDGLGKKQPDPSKPGNSKDQNTQGPNFHMVTNRERQKPVFMGRGRGKEGKKEGNGNKWKCPEMCFIGTVIILFGDPLTELRSPP